MGLLDLLGNLFDSVTGVAANTVNERVEKMSNDELIDFHMNTTNDMAERELQFKVNGSHPITWGRCGSRCNDYARTVTSY